MALVYGLLHFIALAWPAVLHVYFDLFSGAIQTYVFCMLTMTYINNAIGEREDVAKEEGI
jgi:F-type H+-transporting ATPase subunit a